MQPSQPSKFFVSEEDQTSLHRLRVPIPHCEGKRILYLRQSNLLDSTADEAYDRVTPCRRFIGGDDLQTGIALVSLLDIDRQWFKSRVGLTAQQTPRDDAFCSYAILEETPRAMVVLDASKDDRFKANPLVTGAPFIRFYAGASLIVNKVKIGTLCIIDDQPRPDFSAHNEETLTHFADLIADLIAQERQRQLEAMSNFVDLHQHVLSVVQLPLREAMESFHTVERSWKHNAQSVDPPSREFFRDVELFFKARDILFSVVESSLQSLRVQKTPRSRRSSESSTALPESRRVVDYSLQDWETMCRQLMERFDLPLRLLTCDVDDSLLPSRLDGQQLEALRQRRWRLRTLEGHDVSTAHPLATLSLCVSTLRGFFTKHHHAIGEINVAMEADPHCPGCFLEDDVCPHFERASLVISLHTEVASSVHGHGFVHFSEAEFASLNALVQPLHGDFAMIPSLVSGCGCEYRFSIPICSTAASTERPRSPRDGYAAHTLCDKEEDDQTENLMGGRKQTEECDTYAVFRFRKKVPSKSTWKQQQKLFLSSIGSNNTVHPTSSDSGDHTLRGEWSGGLATRAQLPHEYSQDHLLSSGKTDDSRRHSGGGFFSLLQLTSRRLSRLPTAQTSVSSLARSPRAHDTDHDDGDDAKSKQSSTATMWSLPSSFASLFRRH